MTEKLFFVISEITWIFVTFIQNHFRNICYLWYTTVTRTLRLFSDVLNFLKFMQLLRIIFNPHWGIWHLLEFLTPVHEVFKLHNWCAFWTSHVVIESVTENWKTCSTCMFIITCKLLSATSSCTVDMFLMILLFLFYHGFTCSFWIELKYYPVEFLVFSTMYLTCTS